MTTTINARCGQLDYEYDDLQYNDDGSVDLYVGPQVPAFRLDTCRESHIRVECTKRSAGFWYRFRQQHEVQASR